MQTVIEETLINLRGLRLRYFDHYRAISYRFHVVKNGEYTDRKCNTSTPLCVLYLCRFAVSVVVSSNLLNELCLGQMVKHQIMFAKCLDS